MARRRRLGYESLEARHLLSSGSLVHFMASSLNGDAAESQLSATPQVATPQVAGPATDTAAAIRDFLASADSPGSRWNWLAGTQWYVPVENLLAYSTSPDLSDPQPIGDQTIWNIESSSGGQIAGSAVVKLTLSQAPSEIPFAGTVTRGGQIRIEFLVGNGTQLISGLGQMRYNAGSWTMQMQMESGHNPLVTHWAFMTQLEEGVTPPDPSEFSPDLDLHSYEWRWLEGTQWAIRDTQLFGTSAAGVFEIDNFHNGYFWGSGAGTEPFNVLGSVTPEGNLLLLVSVNGADAEARAGQLLGNANGARMVFHSYEGDAAVGSAWTLDQPHAQSIRPLIASVAAQLETVAF